MTYKRERPPYELVTPQLEMLDNEHDRVNGVLSAHLWWILAQAMLVNEQYTIISDDATARVCECDVLAVASIDSAT